MTISVKSLLEMCTSAYQYSNCNCSCNWGTCIASPTRRPRVHHRVNPYLGARTQNETKMFSDHDKTSPSIAAFSAPSVACSMLTVQQQKKLCHQLVDVSAARRGCYTMKHAVSPLAHNTVSLIVQLTIWGQEKTMLLTLFAAAFPV